MTSCAESGSGVVPLFVTLFLHCLAEVKNIQEPLVEHHLEQTFFLDSQ